MKLSFNCQLSFFTQILAIDKLALLKNLIYLKGFVVAAAAALKILKQQLEVPQVTFLLQQADVLTQLCFLIQR